MKESFITKTMFILYRIALVLARKQYLIRFLARRTQRQFLPKYIENTF